MLETVRGAVRRLQKKKMSNCAFECNYHYYYHHYYLTITAKNRRKSKQDYKSRENKIAGLEIFN